MLRQADIRKIDRFIQLLLANATVFVSGERLAEDLRVCRMTICNWVHRLQREGMTIEVKPNVGYRLTQVPDLLLPHLIKRELRTKIFGRNIHHFFQVGSTNDVAFQLAQEGVAEGTVVLSEEQTSGRGRLGRHWVSEKHLGIYMSLILRPRLTPGRAPLLNLAVAVAASRAIEQTSGLTADIKWPNDILINGKKCCGILTEMNADLDQIKYLVMGIGINVNHAVFPKALQAQASSLFLEGGRRFSRIEILLALLKNLEDIYLEFQEKGGEVVLKQWMQRSSFSHGKEVSVDVSDRQVHGTTLGLGGDGALRVRLGDGHIEEIMTGDVVVWK